MKKFELPKLKFSLSDLEPAISAEIMNLHYNKHHAGYVNKLNIFLEKYGEAESKRDLPNMILSQENVAFNGGGHFNHTFFWESLAPKSSGGGKIKKGSLETAIKKYFGSVDKLIEKMSEEAASIQGSGWQWLGVKKDCDMLILESTLNHGLIQKFKIDPILCIDMWEHAYYLQYKNDKVAYLNKIWDVVCWEKVQNRFDKALS